MAKHARNKQSGTRTGGQPPVQHIAPQSPLSGGNADELWEQLNALYLSRNGETAPGEEHRPEQAEADALGSASGNKPENAGQAVGQTSDKPEAAALTAPAAPQPEPSDFPVAALRPEERAALRTEETPPRTRRRRPALWISMAAVAAVAVLAIFLVYGGGWELLRAVWAPSESGTSRTEPTTPTTEPTEPPREVVALPSPLRGGVLSEAELPTGSAEEIRTLLETVTAWNFNTLVVPVQTELPSWTDRLLSAAGARGICIMALLEPETPPAVAEQAAARDFDGFLVRGTAELRESDVTRLLSVLKEGERERRVGLYLTAEGGILRERGSWDFVTVSTEQTTVSEPAFAETLQQWNTYCTVAGMPLYTLHTSSALAGDAEDWSRPEELSLQWEACQRMQSWQGGMMDSLTALREHEEARELLLRQMSGSTGDDETPRVLSFTSPEQTTVHTGEAIVSFRGSADPAFPLWLNGEEVELSAHGLFGLDCTLTAGTNTFTFSHKGRTVVYTVIYEIEVLRSVAPEADLTLAGGTTVAFSAIAYKDATVSAYINGTDIPMTPAPLSSDQEGTENSDYQNFSGEYTLPAGGEAAQELGYLTVFATYGTQTEALQGGMLTVKARPKPTTTEKPTTTTAPTTSPSETTPDTTQPTDPTPPDPSRPVLAEGPLLIITEPYAAETFNGDTVEDYSRPNNAYLPETTVDVLVKESYDTASGNYYYLLGCGRRVYQEEAALLTESGQLTANCLTVQGVAVADGYTTLTLGALWHSPYNLRLLPQDYLYDTRPYPEYDITGCTAEYVEITFAYTTETVGTPDVSASPLFSSAVWSKGDGNTYTLRLYLTGVGQFYGYSASWNDKNELVLEFRHPTYVGDNDASQPLAGMTVMVDAGHGGVDAGAPSLLTGLYEKELNLRYALTLRDKLEALGATVVMVRTEDVQVRGRQIGALTRETRPDLFISVHMNTAGSASANGPSLHYYNEYSYAPAKAIYERIYAAYTERKETTRRGANWDPFYVTRTNDVPCVLAECGFISNVQDIELLNTDDFRDSFCAAMAQGVADYAASLPRLG